MPFTVSHVVAILPLYKYLGRFGVFSALVIGSMVPDFAYMTPYLVYQRMDSHSLVGIYLYGIPMGLTVYFAYHFFMAPVIVSLLPKRINQHLHPDLAIGKIPDIPAFPLVFSIIVGALTHVFWDFFTHDYGIPKYIDWFNTPLTNIDGYNIMPFRVLQHFSTVGGLSLLVFLIWRWIAKRKIASEDLQPREAVWTAPKRLKQFAILVLLLVPVTGAIIFALYNVPIVDDVMFGLYKAQFFLRYAIVSAAALFILCCIFLGIIYHYQIYQGRKK